MHQDQLNLKDSAEFLHLSPDQVEKLARSEGLSARHVKGQLVFSKRELHDWLSQKLLGSKPKSINKFHDNVKDLNKSSQKDADLFLSQFLEPKSISPDLHAKTKGSLLKELVGLAAKSDLVTDESELLQLIEERENLCSTGLVNGVAIPHSRTHSEYLIHDSFLVIAHVPGGIPFGAQDGDLTDLFLMPCANNDRIHLHMIARIALLLQKTDLADELRDCDTVREMEKLVRKVEAEYQ
jgi:PTS system nitrogen regulatory IIA component